MLIAFLKSHENVNAECEIVSFGDRLWLDNGNLTCIRQFIVSVSKDSPCSFDKIRMLIPRESIGSVFDISRTFFEKDYAFNGYTSCGSQINSHDGEFNAGSVTFDGFKCQICMDNIITESKQGDTGFNILAVEFKRPVKPGENRILRLQFDIKQAWTPIFHNSRIFNLNFCYFSTNRKLINIDWKQYEIPVRKLYDAKTRQGGFDIFLYLKDTLEYQEFNPYKKTTTRRLPDGTKGTQTFPKYIWRARALFPNEEYLSTNKTPICIEGLVQDPQQIEKVQEKLDSLEKQNMVLSKESRRGTYIAVLAIFISILLYFLPPIAFINSSSIAKESLAAQKSNVHKQNVNNSTQ